MIVLSPTNIDYLKARKICNTAKEWLKKNNFSNNRAFVKQGDALNFFGVLNEVMVARYFRAEINDQAGWDKGIDITLADGRTVDVKTTHYTNGKLIEFPKDIEKKTNDLYIFCTQTKTSLIVRGWVTREDFIKNAKTKDFGYGERLYMSVTELNQDFEGFKGKEGSIWI